MTIADHPWLVAGLAGLAGLGFATRGIAAAASTAPTTLRCEYLLNPLGIDVCRPRLSWIMPPARRGQRQTAYRVLVASCKANLIAGAADLWDSRKVTSDQSTHVVYEGRPLRSHRSCFWCVRTWDQDGRASAWSQPAFWSMGLLDAHDWTAQWIGLNKVPAGKCPEDWGQHAPSPILRTAFDVAQPVRRAIVSICGLGYYTFWINGTKVGDHVLDPAFTRYDRRVLYATYDVTDMLRPGSNAVGVMLGSGWYNMHTRAVWDFDKAVWRDRPKLLFQLRMEQADGSVRTVGSDSTWRATTGPVLLDGIRNGQWYDARREMPGWTAPGFDDSTWQAAERVAAPKGRLRAQMTPPIKVMQTITPARVTQPDPGVFVFDMGQSFAGWAQLHVAGPTGTTVRMRYGERLDARGRLDQTAIKCYVKQGPFQTDTYVLRGGGDEVWEPQFTYHGFRYVEVTGLPDKPTAATLRGRVVHTSFHSAGSFACSNELLNRIQHMTRWSYRGNFHGYPTDCPHREKNGWTGDAHLAAEQGLYNFDSAPAYLKWLDDFQDEQRPTGELPAIIPTAGWGYQWGNGPAWDSAYILIPWYLYQYTGDRRVLETHYDSMKRYVNYVSRRAQDQIADFGLGDWVPAKTKTPRAVTSTGYYYVDTLLLARFAHLLGRAQDATTYAERAEAIRRAFNKTFYKGDGRYANGSQTALSCALYQGLVARREKPLVVKRLVANVRAHDGHLDTGILGAKYLLNALSATGHHDVAYRIATRTTPPSYGDWARHGATTLYEDWPGRGSLLHVMFGDISAWFYKNLAGIQVDSDRPGFKHTIIRPRPVGDLTWVRAQHESMYGTIRSAWQITDRRFVLDVSIPANTTAAIHVPARAGRDVKEGGVPATQAPGIRLLKMDDGAAVFAVPAGNYQFESTLPGR